MRLSTESLLLVVEALESQNVRFPFVALSKAGMNEPANEITPSSFDVLQPATCPFTTAPTHLSNVPF